MFATGRVLPTSAANRYLVDGLPSKRIDDITASTSFFCRESNRLHRRHQRALGLPRPIDSATSLVTRPILRTNALQVVLPRRVARRHELADAWPHPQRWHNRRCPLTARAR